MKTLLVLPNAIGDVVCGLGIAHLLRAAGEVVWIVSHSAGGIERVMREEGFDCLVTPAGRVKRMAEFGAPVETLRAETKRFLEEVKCRGPFDRVINPHFSLAASRMAGAVEASERFGPSAGRQLYSDTWSDFIASSILQGVLPDISVPERYSLVARMHPVPLPRFESRPRSDHGETIVLQPGSGWPSKALSIRQAARIADRLSEIAPVMLTGSPREAEYLDAVRANSRASLVEFVPGRIEAALEALRSARLVVTTDTWALHAAAALETPALALLGPTRIHGGRIAWGLAPDQEATWRKSDDGSLERISPEDVGLVAAQIIGAEKTIDARISAGTIVWRPEGRFLSPHRRLTCRGPLSERRVFAWARGKAFSDIVLETRSGLPIPILRSRDEMRGMYQEFDGMCDCVLSSLEKYSETFSLFVTTFPGFDANEVALQWCRRTAGYLRE